MKQINQPEIQSFMLLEFHARYFHKNFQSVETGQNPVDASNLCKHEQGNPSQPFY
ncbi:hypothetical protein [Haliscomenobacter sp.]|jgi:hypothetical protein|uniref:hypothetical protein n=1 Tax=Haliscomenobacter sp. TaxID=2717303 RepID=UPI003364CFD6